MVWFYCRYLILLKYWPVDPKIYPNFRSPSFCQFCAHLMQNLIYLAENAMNSLFDISPFKRYSRWSRRRLKVNRQTDVIVFWHSKRIWEYFKTQQIIVITLVYNEEKIIIIHFILTIGNYGSHKTFRQHMSHIKLS